MSYLLFARFRSLSLLLFPDTFAWLKLTIKPLGTFVYSLRCFLMHARLTLMHHRIESMLELKSSVDHSLKPHDSASATSVSLFRICFRHTESAQEPSREQTRN